MENFNPVTDTVVILLVLTFFGLLIRHAVKKSY